MTKLYVDNVDPVSFWRLDESSRFPLTPEEWQAIESVPPPLEVRVSSGQPFDFVANPYGRLPVRYMFRDMVCAFPDSFDEASYALKPHEWCTVYYLDRYPMTALGDPGFDGEQAIRDILERDPSLNDVPREWTGSPDPTAAVLLDIRVELADLKPDTVKAVWAILSFTRSLGMEKNEVLQAPWWSTWWFQAYLVRFN